MKSSKSVDTVIHTHGYYLKDKKGITLIALIITIIVLLILAGVSIALVLGDNGIITKTQKAKADTVVAQEKEQIALEVSGSLDDETGKLYIDVINENIKENIKDVTTDDATEFPLIVTYTTTGHSYQVDWNGKVSEVTIYPKIGEKLKVGDYVIYNDNRYIVLYDLEDEFNWIEIVSEVPLCSVSFGKSDNSSGAQGTYGSHNRAKWSYNNAISKLNNVAQNYLDEDLADRARCVGSLPTNPLNEVNLGPYMDIDNNYSKDVTALRRINSFFDVKESDFDSYWLASRGNDGYGAENSICGIRRIEEEDPRGRFAIYPNSYKYIGGICTPWYDGYEADVAGDGYISENNCYYYDVSSGFRPVIRLKLTDSVIDGDGSESNPYIINK